jgi:hypothetical protein
VVPIVDKTGGEIEDCGCDCMNLSQAQRYLGLKSPNRLYRLMADYGVPFTRSRLNPKMRVFRVADLDRLREEAGLG